MKLTSLKINHIPEPIGYNSKNIVISWIVENFQEIKATKTKNSKITIATDKEMKTIIYESPVLNNQDGSGYKIEMKLNPRTRYYYKVEIESDTGNKASAISFFETSKMEEPWKGTWISCNKKEKRHPIFTKNFQLKNNIKKARLYICGLGLYEAKINNIRVGNEYFTPYCTNYNEIIQYQTYDVTSQLKENNIIEVLIGYGWYSGRFGFNGKEKIYGDDSKLIAELHILYENNDEEIIYTDESWKVKRSNIYFSNIYDGEKIDDTLPEMEIENVFKCNNPKGKLIDRISRPVIINEHIKPIELIISKKNEKIFDLGQNFAGIFKLHVDIPKDKEVYIQTGEILQDNCFYRENLRTAKSEYLYKSNGKPYDIIPHFTFYGYRYVKIEGIENLKKEDFEGLVLYSEMEQIGKLKTSNNKINKLINNSLWGLKSNFLDVPTDCPQRDERMGWTADTQVFTPTACYFMDTYSFYSKYLYDMSTEQNSRNGAVPVVVPAFDVNFTSSVWSDATCIIPTIVYKFFGDITIIKNHYDSMKSWCDYLINMDKDEKKWGKSFHFGDWLSLDVPGQGPESTESATDKEFIAYIYFMQSCEQLSEAAKLLNKNDDEKYYKEYANNLRKYLIEEFYTITGRCAVQTQTGMILTLKHHLSKNENKIKENLLYLLKLSGEKLNTGFVGTPLFCPVLSENNLDKQAYQLLLNEEYPGWLYEVNLGATTTWERWNSVNQNGKITGTMMNSLNHYAYGSITEWMFAYLCGIRQENDSVGFKKLYINPRIIDKIKEVDGYYKCPYGKIRCHWKITGEKSLHVDLEVPFDTSCILEIKEVKKEYTPGVYSVDLTFEEPFGEKLNVK